MPAAPTTPGTDHQPPSTNHSSGIEIRTALPSDSGGIYQVCVMSIRVGAEGHYSRAQIEAWVNRIDESNLAGKIGRTVFLVAETPRLTIAGFVSLNAATREVEYVYVHPDHLRTGLGRRLIEAIETQARRRKIRKVRLISSLNALGFYERIGFVAEQTIIRTLRGVDVPCVIMSKRL
jgi:GNAT superfamily N-acetyltransferase